MKSVLIKNGNKVVTGVTDKNVTKIIVPKGITTINPKAFKGCDKLVSIRLADTIEEIGREAFAECSSLEEIVLPKNLRVLEKFTFQNCTSLKEVTVQEGTGRISIDAFFRCTSLEKFMVSEGNERLCSINDILYNKKKTILLNVPQKHKESEVTVIDGTRKIDRYAFSGCKCIHKVILPDSLEEISDAAFSGSSIKKIVFPQALYTIGKHTFTGCSQLEEVSIPDGISEIPEEVFKNCSSLKIVRIPKSVGRIDSLAFEGCNALEWINVDSENNYYYSKEGKLYRNGVEGAILPREKKLIEPEVLVKEKLKISDDGQTIVGIIDKSSFDVKDLIIPDGITTIEEWAFFKCEGLESITFPESVKVIKKRAFVSCNKLKHVVFPDGIEIIDDYAFANCRKLLLKGLPSKAKYIGVGAFQNNLIKAVKIPSGLKGLKHSAFRGCDSIESFDVEAGNPEYSSKDGVLYNKNMTELLVVPAYARKRKLEIPRSVITVSDNAFLHCKNINKLVINDALENFPTQVFANELKDIEEIEVGKKSKLFQMINGVLLSKDGKAFIKVLTSAQIRNYEIPSTVEEIYPKAFHGCSLIRSITIPESVTHIDKDSFSGCANLRSIKVLCDLHTISANSFSALENRGCVAYVPDKYFIEGFKMTALRNFNVYSLEEAEETEEVYMPDIKVVNVSEKDFAHSLCKRVKLVGQMSLDKIEVISHRIYEYLDISEATFGFEDVRWANILGYSHHGPVYGKSGIRQEDILSKFISTVRVSTLVLPDDIEIHRINYAKYNLSINNIIVRDTCERFAYIDGKLRDKNTNDVVF